MMLRLTDLFHKITRKVIDKLRYCYFKLLIGNIGKGSSVSFPINRTDLD